MDDQGTASLASAIDRRRNAIQARWLYRMQAEVDGRPPSAPALDSICERYLTIIAEVQRGVSEGRERAVLQTLKDAAREHALARIGMGFEVGHVVRDLSLLRRALFEVLREDGVEVTSDAIEKVHESMEFAMAASTKSYVEAYDRAARMAQAEQVAFVAHELRGPLAAASMSTEILRRMGVPSKQHQRMLDRLRLNFQRASRLTEALLEAGYLDSGRATCRLSETTIGEIIDDLVADGRQAAEAKGCLLMAHYERPIRVVADTELTRKALESLLDNAVKYTDHGMIRLFVDQTSAGTSIHVHDSCMGIPPKELAVIFEPFRRGNNGKRGTGLGLSIARRAMEAQGGSIGAESGNGGGCHFWITVPNHCES